MKKYIIKENTINYLFYLFIFSIFIFFIKIIKEINPDPDMYFLAATGRYIVENRVVPIINPFTIHDGLKIIVQQWIIDIVNYLIYDHFGNIGIFIFPLSKPWVRCFSDCIL